MERSGLAAALHELVETMDGVCRVPDALLEELDALPLGRHVLGSGGDWCVHVFTHAARTMESAVTEVHRRYADLHLPRSHGEEFRLYAPDDLESSAAYDPQEDAQFFRTPAGRQVRGISCRLRPGEALLVRAGMAHASQIAVDGDNVRQLRRKLVIKISDRLLPPCPDPARG